MSIAKDLDTVIISRGLLAQMLVALDPLYGFVRKGDPMRSRHLNAIRDERRTALSSNSGQAPSVPNWTSLKPGRL